MKSICKSKRKKKEKYKNKYYSELKRLKKQSKGDRMRFKRNKNSKL